MGLIDEATAISGTSGPQGSKISRIIDSLSGKRRAEVVELIWDHPEITSRAAAEVLTKHYGDTFGTITMSQVMEHRRKPRP
jgi:hypothetical protein